MGKHQLKTNRESGMGDMSAKYRYQHLKYKKVLDTWGIEYFSERIEILIPTYEHATIYFEVIKHNDLKWFRH